MSSAGKIDSLAGKGAVRTPLRGRAPGTRLQIFLDDAFWWLASVALFAGLWEAAWAFGWANPMLLPPPHIFLQDFFAQGKFFNPDVRMSDASPGVIALAVATTVAYSTLRVLTGLALGFAISVSLGMAIRYAPLLGKLVMPTVLLLAPVSPVAWMPVALFVFGIGNAPAIFLVVIALFFIMTLATVSMIDAVSPTYVNVARIMGATRRQIFLQVILPAILPGLFPDTAAQPVRSLDDCPDRRAGRRGQRPRAGRDGRSEHLQLAARVFRHDGDRADRLHPRRRAARGSAAPPVLDPARHGDASAMNALEVGRPAKAKGDIRCIDVGKIWAEGTDRALQALVDIDLEVAPGEFIVLLGPSGCGKSTLLYLISGLETRPRAGSSATAWR